MASIADYLTELDSQRKSLANNLNRMGVTANESEKLNSLVPKVLKCKAEQNIELVEDTNFTGTSNSDPGINLAISRITIPASVTEIGNYAFCRCKNLTSVTVHDSITKIGEDAFYYCSSLLEITIPESVKSIGKGAFEYCMSLQRVIIPNGVPSIEAYTFYVCKKLTSITIPDSVTSFGNYAFHTCSNLGSLIIPDSVTSFGEYLFGNCRRLSDIYYTGTETQWNNITKGAQWNMNLGSSVSGGTTIHYNYVPS